MPSEISLLRTKKQKAGTPSAQKATVQPSSKKQSTSAASTKQQKNEQHQHALTIEDKLAEFEQQNSEEDNDLVDDDFDEDDGTQWMQDDSDDDTAGTAAKSQQLGKTEKSSTTKSKPQVDDSSISWSKLGVQPWLEEHLNKLKMKLPTVIQEKCVPQILAGKHVIGMAQTGTGKTAAFAIPILQNLAHDMFGIYALVLTPTRELALQIKTNFEILAGDLPVRVALLVGGLKRNEMAEMMDRKPHIVVGTPAQVEAAARTFCNDDYFKKIKYLVFDEADQLLRSDASLDINLIIKSCNPKRRTLLFSATMDSHVKKLAQLSLKKDPENVFIYDACKLYKTADNLRQKYMFMPAAVKDCYLYALLRKIQREEPHAICMIFFSSVNNCELVNRTFQRLGINCNSLHAAKQQSQRFEVLEDFRNRRLMALLLTDVGNRGLDIPSITYVINYDLPLKTKYYVHRVGRTARAGQVGTAITMVTQFDVKRLQAIEKDINMKLSKYDAINEEEAEDLMYEIAEERVKAKIDMLESGFIEDYADMKEKREKSSKEVAMAKIMYEKQLIEELKKAASERKQQQQAPQTSAEQPKAEPKKQPASTVAPKEIGGIKLVGGSKGKKKRTRTGEEGANTAAAASSSVPEAPKSKKAKTN